MTEADIGMTEHRSNNTLGRSVPIKTMTDVEEDETSEDGSPRPVCTEWILSYITFYTWWQHHNVQKKSGSRDAALLLSNYSQDVSTVQSTVGSIAHSSLLKSLGHCICIMTMPNIWPVWIQAQYVSSHSRIKQAIGAVRGHTTPCIFAWRYSVWVNTAQ